MKEQPDVYYTMISKTTGEPEHVWNASTPDAVRESAYALSRDAHKYWAIRNNSGQCFELDMTPISPPPYQPFTLFYNLDWRASETGIYSHDRHREDFQDLEEAKRRIRELRSAPGVRLSHLEDAKENTIFDNSLIRRFPA